MIFRRILTIGTLILTGCVSSHYGQRSDEDVSQLAKENGLQIKTFETHHHRLLGVISPRRSDQLHIYIEGDGLAWMDNNRIAHDPTPTTPTALELLTADQTDATKVYLARPGHYLYDARLGLDDWTFARFSRETIDSYDEILDQLQALYPQTTMTLLGYSGGAMIALLTAAQRYQKGKKDIKGIVTFAGVLDHDRWSAFHQTTPLDQSLNSTSNHEILKYIPQKHYAGKNDEIVPPKLIQEYVATFKNPLISLEVVPGVNHWRGWDDFWKKESRLLF